jgi:hypothetical protein
VEVALTLVHCIKQSGFSIYPAVGGGLIGFSIYPVKAIRLEKEQVQFDFFGIWIVFGLYRGASCAQIQHDRIWYFYKSMI